MTVKTQAVADVTDYLIWLEAARHAILVDATATVGQAAFTDVLSGAGSVHIAAAVNQQVVPLADITWSNKTTDKHKH